MPRKLIRRFIPDHDTLRNSTVLSWLGDGITNPQLWHLNRRSVSGAVAVGLFVGWLPVPMQTALAAFLAMILHVNLPVSALLVWISNPFTIPALLYAAYSAGARLLGIRVNFGQFEPSLSWFMHQLQDSWQPLLAGCLFLGTLSALVGFFLTRILWRVSLLRRWEERRRRKLALKDAALAKR